MATVLLLAAAVVQEDQAVDPAARRMVGRMPELLQTAVDRAAPVVRAGMAADAAWDSLAMAVADSIHR